MKIYISGKISGIENEAPKLFQEVEDVLIANSHEVVNPMKLPHNHDKSWESYMKEDLKAMLDCDGVVLLNNWFDSKGAKIECDLAEKLGMDIYNTSHLLII
jgi:nucleoside 2-deoxyribosyltransferase